MAKKRIVVLDSFTLNPGDLSWENLNKLGNCTIYDRTSKSEIYSHSKDANVLLTNKTPLSEQLLKKLHNLEYIVVTATGVNIVDLKAAHNFNIPVSNVPAYGASSVAQMVFAHILNLSQHVSHHNHTVKKGKWTASLDWCYWDFPLVELAGKKIGIIGFGQIGQKVAQVASSFEMDVLIHTRDPQKAKLKDYTVSTLDNLLKESDYISLHCPLTNKTNQLINKNSLAKMKKSALLINTSRGGLINEQDLAQALNNGTIAGACLDVLSTEPPSKENPLLLAKNCVITPHIAWATKEARQRLMNIVVKNIKSFLSGKNINIVNS